MTCPTSNVAKSSSDSSTNACGLMLFDRILTPAPDAFPDPVLARALSHGEEASLSLPEDVPIPPLPTDA